MISFFQAIVLGIVEGITEFLPISSTAHLDFSRFFLQISTTDFVKSFIIIIQFGAILSVVVLYWKKIFGSFIYFKNIIIAFIPTGLIGFVLYKIIKGFLIGNTFLAALILILGGIVILIFEKVDKERKIVRKEKIEELTVPELLILGIAQALAVVPGISRSGAVIIAGRSMKLSSPLIAEFSFLLAIPTMLAASLYDIYKSGIDFSKGEWGTIALGFIISFIVALIVVKWLINYVKNHSFSVFGWYRIVVGVLIFLIIFV
jgi:undecaprenyl-diphosphatase